jgi:hypothetical protein
MANINLYRVAVPAGSYSKVDWIECEGYYGPTQYLQNGLLSIDFQAQNNTVSASAAATVSVIGYCLDDCTGCYLIGETTTTSTTIPPVDFTLTPTCEGTGINGTGKITVNGFSGGNGTYTSVAIGNSAGSALSATPVALSGASTYSFTGVFNGTWHIILRDSSGASTTKSTAVNCTNTTTTTSTSTTSTTSTSTSTTSTTTAAINCNYNGGTAVMVYGTTTTTTSGGGAPTTTSTTTGAPTTTSTTTGAPTTSTTTTTTTVAPNTFNVTANGSSNYIINGSSNPTLSITEGQTYTFNINASGHPFWIKTVSSTGTGNSYSSGITNNGTDNGTITFVVPYDAPSTLYYNCQFHLGMAGTINVTDVSTTTTTTTGAPSATLQWDFEEMGGADGSMVLYVNGSVIETRYSTSSGTYAVYEGDTINVEVSCNTCFSPNDCSTAESQSNKSVLVASDTVNSGAASIFTSVYTVVSGDIGNNINLSTFAICNSTCL